MKRVVIFDFNRTLFDPDSGKLIEGAKDILATLVGRGYSLFLVSHGQVNSAIFGKLDIVQYFEKILSSRSKSKRDFEKLLVNVEFQRSEAFVIGDRVRKEIKIGNKLGLKTIWLRKGKFALERPEALLEKPGFIIEDLREVTKIVK